MKILFCSHVFAPSVGGIETVGALLAKQFSRLGLEITVVTNTPGEGQENPYQIIRRPSLRNLVILGRKADVVFQNNVSLRTLLPLFLCRKPVVVIHHGPISRLNGTLGWQDYLKRALIRRCRNLSISKAVAATLPLESTVIGNPFEIEEFDFVNDVPRTKDIVFLGRLVSQKGCDLALEALRLLKQDGLTPSLSIIGDGPELSSLKAMAKALDIAEQVEFLGAIREGRGHEIARHKILIVPSRYAEPFGLVAIEGLAAGCVIVASREGGLPEAVGKCGVLFPNGDAKELSSALKRLLLEPLLRKELLSGRHNHLMQFRPESVAERYVRVFNSVLSH